MSAKGKTTMLNLLGCLDKPTSGSYYLEDREVSRLSSSELAEVRSKKIGFIFQTFNLLPRLSALANVELGMRYAGGGDRQQAMEALAKVGLAERINHRPTEMSGGEQQRVAIAHALAKNPSLILADGYIWSVAFNYVLTPHAPVGSDLSYAYISCVVAGDSVYWVWTDGHIEWVGWK